MGRRAKPEDETPEQARTRRILESVSNNADRSEKTSWTRKMDNMIKLLSKLRPIEDQIIELSAQKMPIFDDVQQLRETMVTECIHPYQHLVLLDNDVVLCKFCNRKVTAKANASTN